MCNMGFFCYTINMALNPNALTTVANVQEALGLGSVDTTKIENIIHRVTSRIESKTKRKLKARNYDGVTAHGGNAIVAENPIFFDRQDVEVHDGRHVIYLPEWPVQRGGANDITFELAYLTNRDINGEEFSTANFNEWESWVIQDDTIILDLLAPTVPTLTNGLREYRLKATLGYNTIPLDLEAACIEMCKMLYSNTAGVTSERIEGWSRTYDWAQTDWIINDVIADYKRIENL